MKTSMFYIVIFSAFLASASHTLAQPMIISPSGNYPNWTRLKDSPTYRFEAASVAYNGKIYVFHGLQENFALNNTTDVYDPFTDTWTTLAPIPDDANGNPSGLTHYGIALVADTVWLVGGRRDGIGDLTSNVWLYSINNNTWTQGPALPAKWASRSLVKLGRKLYLFGGGTHVSYDISVFCLMITSHYVLDLDNQAAGWKKINSSLPVGMERIHGAGVSAKGKIYLLGGQLGHDCGSDDVGWGLVYDPYTQKWTRLADLPQGNSHAEPGTFTIDGRIIMVGGKTLGRKVMEYFPNTNEWKEIDILKDENGSDLYLLGPSAKVIGDKMIVSNGSTEWGGSMPTKKTYIKNFVRNPIFELGFSPANVEVQLDASVPTIKKSAWLWTVTGTTDYQIDLSNLPSWLQIKRDAGNSVDESAVEFRLSFNAQNLPNGIYTHQVTATANGYTPATLTIKMTVGAAQNPVIQPISNQVTFEEPTNLQINAQHYQPLTYQATNLPNGLSIDATSGLISGTIQENASQNSPYLVEVQVNDVNNPTLTSKSTFVWTVKPINTAIYAVNARGENAVNTAGIKFLADYPTPLFNTSNWWFGRETYNQIANAAPYSDAIYQIQRTNPTNLPLNVNLPNGDYTITFHFAELYMLSDVGENLMNVNIEGNTVLSNFDIYASSGGLYKAVRRTFNVTLNDGTLNINFVPIKGEVRINAIHIAPVIQPINNPPVLSNAIGNQTVPYNTASSFSFAANTFSDPEMLPLFYTATLDNGNMLPDWLTFNATNRTFNVSATPNSVGTYTIKVTAIDKGGLFVSTNFILTVQASNNIDTDGDGILDNMDNCPTVFNPTQIIPTWFADLDKDGFGDPNNSMLSCSKPPNYVADNTDECPNDPTPNGKKFILYLDQDKDGLGNPAMSMTSCKLLVGYVTNNTDCNDLNAAIGTATTWFADLDKDGFGDPNNSLKSCTKPENYVSDNTDECPEVATKEGKKLTWFADLDKDGFGDPNNSLKSCTKPENYVSDNTDECPEVATKEGKKLTWFADLDKDGFGSGQAIIACQPPQNGTTYAQNNLDCEDSDNTIYPNAPKTNDGKDNDCNNLRGTISKLILYPNPTSDGKFYLDYPKSNHEQILLQLIDLNGKVVYEKNIKLIQGQLNSLLIDLRENNTNISSGAYILVLQSATQTDYIKVVKFD